MSTKANCAILLTFLMISSGCMGLFDQQEELPDIVDCIEQPIHSDCVDDTITADDCRIDEVFTGDSCRQMVKPSDLTYGEESITLQVANEMQALTPSFLGDGPDTWLINPNLPNGLVIDRETGVIFGVATAPSQNTRYTIVASNFMGSISTSIDIQIISLPPSNIEYSSTTIDCVLDKYCSLLPPSVGGGNVESWSVSPSLPHGIILLQDGSIEGSPSHLGDSNHTITASNQAGEESIIVRIIVLHDPPMGLSYDANRFELRIGNNFQQIPFTSGGEIVSWSVEPPLPDGLTLHQIDGSIRGTPNIVQSLTTYLVTATNTAGSINVEVLISVSDIAVSNIQYSPYEFDLEVNQSIGWIEPTYSGGTPDSWYIEPLLPSGFTFDAYNGTIFGTAEEIQNWSTYYIWANNTGGSTYTTVRIKITSAPPDLISWEGNDFAFASNESVFIQATNDGPDIESWSIEPTLPQGMLLLENGSISGTPTHRTDWTEYTITATNTGGSVALNIWIVIHDLRADQSDLLRGMTEADWGGWPSPILPIGEWAFPVAFESSGIPVVSAGHVGKGKMLGYGHESWVDATDHSFSLRAVEWVCGENAEVGLAYGAGFDDFEDELRDAGHNVHFSVTPADLGGIDCLLDEFWNGHDDSDNTALTEFMLAGGGLIMGGHAWYWSYSNSDVAHNYPGNKIAKTTGLFVSNDWGYNDVYFQNMPDEYSTISNAIPGVLADRVDGVEMDADNAATAYSALSHCTGVVTLDYTEFWSPLRHLVNQTGYTVIPYSTLWSSTGHELGEDSVADIILRLEEALMSGLPADELPVHPSHVEFPGEVPADATRVSEIVFINGTQSGLPSNFGYSGARSSLRMSTGLYAPPGEIITISVTQNVSEMGFDILIGAHTDGLWHKDVIKRHSKIYRTWSIDNTTTEVGNAFGGPIYASIPAGSDFGLFEITISGAVRAPMFTLWVTSEFEWLYSERDQPAPWAELVSDNFILTVPSDEIRNLNNPFQLMQWWDDALDMEHELYGFTPWPRVERAVFDAQISAGWMHSGYPFMAHDLSVPDVVDYDHMSENGDWGMFHELGHNHQWMPSTLPGTTETGCNFASVHLMEDLVGVEGHSAVDPEQRAARMESYFDDGSNISNWSVWIALDTYILIKEEWGWGPITEALSIYYTLPPAEVPTNDTEEFNAWVMHLSNATGYNLALYHSAWGFPLTQNTFDSLSHLPVWVDDPLRGENFVYDAILRNLSSPDPSDATSTTISWETYDNGTNTTLTFYYGTTDMGNQTSGWDSSTSFGSATVGNHSQIVSGLTCCGTNYYGRIQASNEENSVWFGPLNWTTDYLAD